jgi:hypothetical protein
VPASASDFLFSVRTIALGQHISLASSSKHAVHAARWGSYLCRCILFHLLIFLHQCTIAPRMKRLTSVTSQFGDRPHHQQVFLESIDLSH